jgi:hypothetical protein
VAKPPTVPKPYQIPVFPFTGHYPRVHVFVASMNEDYEDNPAWMSFVRARGVGHDVEEDARVQLAAFQQGFSHNV